MDLRLLTFALSMFLAFELGEGKFCKIDISIVQRNIKAKLKWINDVKHFVYKNRNQMSRVRW